MSSAVSPPVDRIAKIAGAAGIVVAAAGVAASLWIGVVNREVATEARKADQFLRSTEQLASPAADSQLGAILALQQLMEDDDDRYRDRGCKLVYSFARSRAPRVPAPAGDSGAPTGQSADQPRGASANIALFGALNVLGSSCTNPGWDLDLRGLDLSRAEFRGATLRDLDLQGSSLQGADLSDANLNDTLLVGADLRGVQFVRAQLRDSGLFDTDMEGASFVAADLNGSYLGGSNLRNADLAGADLTRADLSDAALVSADLGRAIFTGANLRGANLTGANLLGAIDLELAHHDATTIWPSGYIPPE